MSKDLAAAQAEMKARWRNSPRLESELSRRISEMEQESQRLVRVDGGEYQRLETVIRVAESIVRDAKEAVTGCSHPGARGVLHGMIVVAENLAKIARGQSDVTPKAAPSDRAKP